MQRSSPIRRFSFLLLSIVGVLTSSLVAQTSSTPANPTEQPDSTPLFSSGVSNVRIDVQVTEGQNLVAGLAKEDFAIFDTDKQQPLVYFGRDAEPLTLLLLLDVSGSTKDFLEQIASTARQALRYLQPKDRVAIMNFARRSRVSQEWTTDMSTVASQIRDGINDQTLGSGTNINDALLEAARYIDETAGDSGRHSILIITDNLGLNYRSPDQPVIDAMYAADTVLNSIVFGKGKRPEPVSGKTYQNPDFTSPDVFRIAEETGGEAVRSDKAGQAFSSMIERIRTRYSLHYTTPPNAAPGFHSVTVMLSPAARLRYPQAVLRYRKGYRVRP